jgi:hypothetical protein
MPNFSKEITFVAVGGGRSRIGHRTPSLRRSPASPPAAPTPVHLLVRCDECTSAPSVTVLHSCHEKDSRRCPASHGFRRSRIRRRPSPSSPPSPSPHARLKRIPAQSSTIAGPGFTFFSSRSRTSSAKAVKVRAMPDLEDLRFPIGASARPPASLPGIRAAHMKPCASCPERLREVNGLSDAQLDTPYREGGWTVRQVVHHIADSHANCYIRFKLALTEDWPTIKPYDEVAWAEPGRQPLAARSMFPWPSLRDSTAAGSACLSLSQNRTSTRAISIPEMGRKIWPRCWPLYDWHSRHHTAHITSLRAGRAGKASACDRIRTEVAAGPGQLWQSALKII